MSDKHDRAAELRAIADGRLMLNVRNGVTVSELERALAERAGGATHRHKKRGTEYVLIGIGKMQCDWWQIVGDGTRYPVDMREVAIYRSVDDDSLWARPREEFEDGRFETLTTEPAAPEDREAVTWTGLLEILAESSFVSESRAATLRAIAEHLRFARPSEQAVTEAMVEAGARAIAQAWGENWECCCAERRGLDCDCGDAMTDERDGYDERLSREDCRMAARAALKAAMEAGHD